MSQTILTLNIQTLTTERPRLRCPQCRHQCWRRCRLWTPKPNTDVTPTSTLNAKADCQYQTSMPAIDASHRCQTSMPNIDAKHQCQTSMPNINAKHRCQTSMPNIDAKHRCQTLMPNIDAKHWCQTPMPNIDAKHRCQTSMPNFDAKCWCPMLMLTCRCSASALGVGFWLQHWPLYS